MMLPIFYKNPVLIEQKTHGDLGLKTDIGFGFSKAANAVPINMAEIPMAQKDMAIIFVQGQDHLALIAILGKEQGKNAFLLGDQWRKNSYIPAYIRRYPYILSEDTESKTYSLCIDHHENTIDADSPYRFYEDNAPSDMLVKATNFCKSYQQAVHQTQVFCQKIQQLGLLKTLGGYHNIIGTDILTIDEEKLIKMKDNDFLTLKNDNYLPYIYAQILSLSHLMS